MTYTSNIHQPVEKEQYKIHKISNLKTNPKDKREEYAYSLSIPFKSQLH